MLKSWCHIFRGSHLIGGYSTILDFRPLNYIVSCSLELRLWFDLYLGRDIKSTLQSLLLEVRKLEKIEGVAYLEGRFKSNKCGILQIHKLKSKKT